MQGESTPGPVMSREWLGWGGISCMLSYPGKDNDVHGGKEPRSAQVAELLPTLMSQPKFGTSRPPALAPILCTQEAALPMACSLLPLLNTVY